MAAPSTVHHFLSHASLSLSLVFRLSLSLSSSRCRKKLGCGVCTGDMRWGGGGGRVCDCRWKRGHNSGRYMAGTGCRSPGYHDRTE
ncbi:hypothetical protein Hanom_Chr14g01281351 [Helianthus anomalus]